MLKNKLEIENIIQRYLDGETSEMETQQTIEWLQATEENRQLFARHKKLWLGSSALAGYGADKIKREKEKVDLKIHNIEMQRRLVRARRRIRTFAYAASVVLLMGITSVIYVISRHETLLEQEVLVAGGTIEVPYGSKSLVTLPDGSKLWVNAGSKISYPADFGVTSRNVYLSGEAYFDVAKMEGVPFFVNTDVLTIKVYGTAFNVKAYADDDRVETTLDHGAISIVRNDAPDRIIIVEPNQKITFMREASKDDDLSEIATSAHTTAISSNLEGFETLQMENTQAATAWKDDRMVFEQEPLWSIARKLERRYNVQIRIVDENIKFLRYTATMKEMPIEQVLEAISLTSPITFTINDMEVILMENINFTIK